MNLNEAISYLEHNGYDIKRDDVLDEGLKDWIKAIKEKAAGFTKKKLEAALAKAISKEGFKSLETVFENLKKAFPDKADSIDQLMAKIDKVIESSKKEASDDIDVNEPALASESWAIKYDMPMLNEGWDWEWDVNSEYRKSHLKGGDDHSSVFWIIAHLIMGWALNFWEAFTGHEEFYGHGKLGWFERLLSFFAGMRDMGLLIGVILGGISILLVLSGVPAKELASVYAERIGDAITFLKNIV